MRQTLGEKGGGKRHEWRGQWGFGGGGMGEVKNKGQYIWKIKIETGERVIMWGAGKEK